MSEKMKQVKEYLYISFDFVLFIAIPMCFGIAALATSLAPWFFESEFTMVNKVLMIEAPVIILIGLSNVIGQQYLLPTKQTRTYTVSVVLGAVTNIVINIPLILKYGVYGAMIATLLSELTVTSYQLIKVRTALKLSKLFANVGKYMFAAVIMFMQVYVLNICMKISAISLFFQIIIGLLIYIGMICILQPSILQRIKKLR